MSARKMRLVADNIRGKDVATALDILRFSKREGAYWLEKVLLSAISNWEQKTGEDAAEYDLYIKKLLVDEGPFLKRFRPAPHGRAHRIRKRTNHVTIVLENRVELEAAEDMVTYEEEE